MHMANLLRSAKSSNDWTQGDLDAYNIHVHVEDTATFFGTPNLSQPPLFSGYPEILNIENADNMNLNKHAELITLLDLAMVPTGPEESAVDDFTVELFKTLGYVWRRRVARTRKDIPFLVCGEWRHAQADVCLVDHSRNDIMLLVQEAKRSGGEENISDAEAQLTAQAIATFSLNNSRRRDAGLPELNSRIMPGIVMLGTMPTFYKIHVTDELVFHVRHGTYPPQPTRVSVFYPPVPRPHSRWNEGMKPLDNRREVLRCYEAFKKVVGITVIDFGYLQL